MDKAELESKHLAELHALAAEAGVERYRMLSRSELIAKLADGGSGGGNGGGERQSRSGSSRSRRSRGGRSRSRGGESRRRTQPEKREEPEKKSEPAQASPPPGGGEAPKPRRRHRRRRFRKGGRSVRAGELILAAPGGQSIVYGESRASCTALLRDLAAQLSGGRGPDPVAVLIDPSPEELADWKREAPKAEIVSAGQDRHAADALAQAASRAEAGEAVVLLVDSVSRMAESFGSNVAKDLLADGRGVGGSGTLTVVAAVERSA
jgi:Rho termination factor, N-terminal domain